MTISMYQASAPRFVGILTNLSAILDKAQARAEALKPDPETLSAFLFQLDMSKMPRQVQIACNTAEGAVASLAGMPVPNREETEQSLAELKVRIANSIAFVRSFKPAQLDGTEDNAIPLTLCGRGVTLMGIEYLLGHVIPSFHFHVMSAYNILRQNGVELGKCDYLGIS